MKICIVPAKGSSWHRIKLNIKRYLRDELRQCSYPAGLRWVEFKKSGWFLVNETLIELHKRELSISAFDDSESNYAQIQLFLEQIFAGMDISIYGNYDKSQVNNVQGVKILQI